MKKLFTLLILGGVAVTSTYAQNNISSTRTTEVKTKETLKQSTPEQNDAQSLEVGRRVDAAQRVDITQSRQPVEMTDEFIDGQIAEIQKVIDENVDNPEFNLSGYQKRISYLESRRPKK